MTGSTAPPAPRRVTSVEEAVEIARAAIRVMDPATDWVVVEAMTQERAFGWVFGYAPRRFLETRDRRFMKPGNGPVVVLRETAQVRFLSSSMPPARAVEVFEAEWRRAAVP